MMPAVGPAVHSGLLNAQPTHSVSSQLDDKIMTSHVEDVSEEVLPSADNSGLNYGIPGIYANVASFNRFYAEARPQIPEKYVKANRLYAVCAQALDTIHSFLNHVIESPDNSPTADYPYNSEILLESTKKHVLEGLQVIEEALSAYSLNEISMSFNGGKDCLVMLILYLCALINHSLLNGWEFQHFPKKLNAVYVYSENAFEEAERFTKKCEEEYQLDLIKLPGPMKSAFDKYIHLKATQPGGSSVSVCSDSSTTSAFNIKAILVGIRRTDPYGENLTFFQRTDHGWPDFMRVHPIIDWKYNEIWEFLLRTKTEYCSLYDLGYTSLGGTNNTEQNPLLSHPKTESSEQVHESFRQAYYLRDDYSERLGRTNGTPRSS